MKTIFFNVTDKVNINVKIISVIISDKIKDQFLEFNGVIVKRFVMVILTYSVKILRTKQFMRYTTILKIIFIMFYNADTSIAEINVCFEFVLMSKN
ncbi:MAG: hypothetical protein LBP59_10795 [Planctomycetaceae bacterium]|nr:hypothetical protein [Planctomycetaceae bacterium]